ncbi:MAG: lysine--tRNA ligase, partial [Polaribacter sp.]|nr:lysine--tRNA ligase [Polaribacter sp.]
MFDFVPEMRDKALRLRSEGTEPYPNNMPIDCNIDTVVERFDDMSVVAMQDVTITSAGRLRFKNEMGRLGFGRVNGREATVQIMVSKKTVGLDQFATWKALDIGDWVWFTGSMTRTRMGELTVNVTEIRLYSKNIGGMPDRHVGLTNQESRTRMRYLDMAVNDDSREVFITRSRITSAIRRHLEERNFLEVETPTLQAIPGGATAKPFVTHHNALDMDLYMRIAPELYLKRLIVGGLERVYEIGKNFRNEGIDSSHNPEFTTVEFYMAHATYRDLMEMTRNMITEIVGDLYGLTNLVRPYGEHSVDYGSWSEARFDELLTQVGVQGDPYDIQNLHNFWNTHAPSEDDRELPDSVGDMFTLIFDEYIEHNLINPTFVTHYPTEISPLARRNDEDPRVTDRFELFIAGMEVANAFSELNDPMDQAERFAAQVERKDAGDDEAMYFDSDYVRALTYGMPPTAGEGIGIDRLVMLL